MTKPNFYITTPIYYVNDKPHIGHAYTTIACDVVARFKRLDGFQVKFLTGTDEHGLKVLQAAQKAGITPQELTDKVSVNFRDMNTMLGITADQFIRTTESFHKKAVQAIWQKMEAAGDIYLSKYSGWYSVRDEAYYGEDELTVLPNGTKVATASNNPVEWMEEESYFFKLSAWGDKLLAFYDKHPEFIQPSYRRNEIVSFVKSGLQDISISRTAFDWGVKVPGNDKHVMYVWVDALTNYISALGYPDTSGEFKSYWPADLHVVGKDILRFHAVYWPAFLMSAGLELPKRIFAHGWWLAEGQKMSKSLGNVISPEHLVKTYGIDASRYFMLREVPFGQDGDFSHASAIARINAELANNIGNLAQRTLSLIAKNCDGKIPNRGVFTEEPLNNIPHGDALLFGNVKDPDVGLLKKVKEHMDALQFHKVIEEVISVAMLANEYIDKRAPWALKKTDPARMETVLYVLAEVIRNLALVLQPFTPTAAGKILDQLAVPANERDFSFIGEAHALKAGTPLPAPSGVFPRIVDATEAKTA